MISGFATAQGTKELAGRSTELAFNPLGRTGLQVSCVGFGCYRVTTGVSTHTQALLKALQSGVNLIDTSANYADGGSERLVGQVLGELIDSGSLKRDQVVVVSKGGYLQGRNWERHRERLGKGKPFQDVVTLKEGLAHCIHPEFLDDQIGRSLDRLKLQTIDGYLLHNPEYYLAWARDQGHSLETSREEYYRRIEKAFRYLETEVARKRIRYYGVSSNTFPSPADDSEFTELQRILQIAETIDAGHHFKIIQLPFNLLESGAIVEKNQPNGKSALDLAREKEIGVLTNRPLNAITAKRMVRLAGIEVRDRLEYSMIITRIKDLAQSETRLWRKILPQVDAIPGGVQIRIKQQGCFAETLKHHWRSFGSYGQWREAKDSIFAPRIQGVMNYLEPHAKDNPELAEWMSNHDKVLKRAFRAVASIYAEEAVALERNILRMVEGADPDGSLPDRLSQTAVVALISTAGISTALVGMRKPSYVSDVLAAAGRSNVKKERALFWQRLSEKSKGLFAE
jgi:aryl-alcohol dehydrogenase-like predicted oxidoreductase